MNLIRLVSLRRRRSTGVGIGLIILLGVLFFVRGPGRHTAADFLGVRLKNDVIAVYSIATAPSVQTDDLVPIANNNLPPYAVNVFLDQEVQTSNVERTLDLVKADGFHYIKQELLWHNVERPQKGEYQDRAVAGKSSWANYDRIVNLAQQKGIGVIFRIDTSPTWAQGPQMGNPANIVATPPEDYQAFGDFVAAVVKRYKGRVHYYQIWNEPNLASEWGGYPPNPAAYTRLLRIAYTRAKEVDPSVVILSAALAPTVQNDHTAMPDTVFLQKMYDAGARPYFDVMSTNAYGLRDGPDDWRLNQTNDVNFSRPILLRQIMVRNGDASKPIWASEIGWNSLPANWSKTHPKSVPIWGSVSRALQAEYTVRAYQRAAEQWPWMDIMAVWQFRMVYPQNRDSQQYYFDMVSVNWKPEPIYYALQKLMRSPPVIYRGYHQEDDWALTWKGPWQEVNNKRASLGKLKITAQAGAELDFNLQASWLDLVTPVGPQWGKLAITIDGQPLKANRLPIQDGHAVLNLQSSTERWQVRQPIADGLGPGVHHVQIRVLSGKVGIDGIIANSPSPKVQLFDGATGVIIGLGTLGVAIWRRPRSVIAKRDS